MFNKLGDYDKDHKIAKVIVCSTVIALLVINRSLDSVYLDVFAVVVWFFGINPIARLLEIVFKHSKKHDLI
jgi:hypothetical protein